MNVYLDTKKSSSSFNSVLYAFNPLFESTLGMPGSSKKHPIDKTDLWMYTHMQKSISILQVLEILS